jgi:hypothetical protein
MITSFVNEFFNFLHSVFSLGIVLVFAKFILRFGFGLRLPKFTVPHMRVSSRISAKTHSKEWYDLQKYKLDAKYRYKLCKYEARLKLKADSKRSGKFASITDYLKVVK